MSKKTLTDAQIMESLLDFALEAKDGKFKNLDEHFQHVTITHLDSLNEDLRVIVENRLNHLKEQEIDFESLKRKTPELTPGSRFRVQFDFEYKGDPGKKMDDTLETQPDMSLTVRQLLLNHTRGHDGQVREHTPIYFDTNVPVLSDITDVHEYKAHLEDQLNQTNQFIKQDLEKAEKEREKLEEQKKQEQLDLVKEIEKTEKPAK